MLDVLLSRARPPFVLFVLVPFVRSVLFVVLLMFFMSLFFLLPVVLLAPMAFGRPRTTLAQIAPSAAVGSQPPAHRCRRR